MSKSKLYERLPASAARRICAMDSPSTPGNSTEESANAFARALQRWADLRGARPEYLDGLAASTSQMTIADQEAIEEWFEDVLSFLRRIDFEVFACARVKSRIGTIGIEEFLNTLRPNRASIGQCISDIRASLFKADTTEGGRRPPILWISYPASNLADARQRPLGDLASPIRRSQMRQRFEG